jgi:hypothetical protein
MPTVILEGDSADSDSGATGEFVALVTVMIVLYWWQSTQCCFQCCGVLRIRGYKRALTASG